ncbi:MAG: carbohydrate binding domain-containing protein [Clostridiales bacterium]|nr:carbohydrate binding domain-containing protein [Clostridiales bacterium]
MKTKIKKTHKLIAAVLAIGALSTAMFVGCADAAENEKPVIEGAGDFDCIINEPIDLLSKVVAYDKEDGDITPKMTISISPEVQVTDGIAIFPEQTEYEITYSVTDSNGNTASATSYVTTYDRLVYENFKLVELDGFSVDVGGSAKLETQSVVGNGDQGKFLFKVTGAQNDGDAVLSRTYSLTTGAEYQFTYMLNSKTAGSIKSRIGQTEQTHEVTADADSTVSFTYAVPQDENKAKADVKVELLLGGLGDDIDVSFVKAVAEHEEDVTHAINFIGKKDIALNSGSVIGRFDTAGGRDNLKGTAKASDDQKSVTLEITGKCNDMWAGGMFVKTGMPLKANVNYTLSFDTTAENDDEFAVMLQNKQWDETKYKEEWFNKGTAAANSRHANVSFTPTADNPDGLWLYVQSGNAVNKITLSNLSLYESVYDRFDNGVEGTATVQNASAILDVTKASETDIWAGGMFIDTSVRVQAGKEYKVAFDVDAQTDGDFEVILQNKQWDEAKYLTEQFNKGKTDNSGHKELTFTPTSTNAAGLWLYVQSGKAVNTIAISNLTVTANEKITEQFRTANLFTMNRENGTDKDKTVWKDGNLIFTVQKFSEKDNADIIKSPEFYVGTGAFGDYYISFKAKASAPVKVVLVGPNAGGWDPNLVWAEMTLSETETLYTIKSNALSDPTNHRFEWQFGFAVNGQYENVTIEISEVKICEKSIID